MELRDANVFVALLAGFLSFASPCVLPLVPVYLGYMSGASVQRGRVQAPRARVVAHALAFVIGFSLVFILLGIGAGFVSDWLQQYRLAIQRVGGVLLIIFALHTLGVFQIGFLNYERRLGSHIHPNQNLGYLRSSVIGMGFALGWTPCVGPMLALILNLAYAGQQATVLPLFIAYAAGLGIPFVLTALLAGQLTLWLRRIMARSFDLRMAGRTLLANLNPISVVSGVLLLLMGGLLFFDRVTWLNTLLPQWTLGV